MCPVHKESIGVIQYGVNDKVFMSAGNDRWGFYIQIIVSKLLSLFSYSGYVQDLMRTYIWFLSERCEVGLIYGVVNVRYWCVYGATIAC